MVFSYHEEDSPQVAGYSQAVTYGHSRGAAGSFNSPKRFALADILIIALVISLAAFLLVSMHYAPAAGISVTVEGKPYGRWPLPATPETLSIAGQMRVIIDKSGARVLDATCPRGLCRHQGALTAAGQSIVCVPNRICIQLDGGERIDAQTR